MHNIAGLRAEERVMLRSSRTLRGTPPREALLRVGEALIDSDRDLVRCGRGPYAWLAFAFEFARRSAGAEVVQSPLCRLPDHERAAGELRQLRGWMGDLARPRCQCAEFGGVLRGK